MDTYEQRVAKGAELLDETVPGWASKIHTDDLDITSPQRCILGQLFGSFARGLSELFGYLGDGWAFAPDYGFNLTPFEWDNRWDDDEPAAEELLSHWFIEIEKRTLKV